MNSSARRTNELLTQLGEKEALLSVFRGDDPETVIAMVEELTARGKLQECFSELNRDGLGLLLKFVGEHLKTARYSDILMDLTKKTFELRAEDIKASDELMGHVGNLYFAIEEDRRTVEELEAFRDKLSAVLGSEDDA